MNGLFSFIFVTFFCHIAAKFSSMILNLTIYATISYCGCSVLHIHMISDTGK